MVVAHKETQWCKAVWALIMCHGDEVTVAAPSASGIINHGRRTATALASSFNLAVILSSSLGLAGLPDCLLWASSSGIMQARMEVRARARREAGNGRPVRSP